MNPCCSQEMIVHITHCMMTEVTECLTFAQRVKVEVELPLSTLAEGLI